MESIEVGDYRVTVEDTALIDRQGRPVFEWSIVGPDGVVIGSGQDLKGPMCGREPSEREMMATLFAFLAAELDSVRYGSADGDNWLFEKPVRDWLEDNSLVIETVHCDLGDDDDDDDDDDYLELLWSELSKHPHPQILTRTEYRDPERRIYYPLSGYDPSDDGLCESNSDALWGLFGAEPWFHYSDFGCFLTPDFEGDYDPELMVEAIRVLNGLCDYPVVCDETYAAISSQRKEGQ